MKRPYLVPNEVLFFAKMKRMVFCFQNCSDLLGKNCCNDQEKKLKIDNEGQESANIFEITITIYSNSERSELVPVGFSDLIH